MHKSNLWVETICVSLTQIFKKRIKSMGLIKFVSMSLSCRQLSPYHLGLVHLCGLAIG